MVNLTFPHRGLALVEEVARALRTRIASLQVPGDKLPTVRQLSTLYGVSPTVVREAVATLRAEGLLDTRQGSGIYVARTMQARRFEFAAGAPGEDGPRLIYELRLGVEVAASRLAALRRTREQVEALRGALAAMAGPADRVAADVAFHCLVASATANPHFERLVPLLRDELEDLVREAVTNTMASGRVEAVIEEHARILEAIERGDAEGAAEAMGRHLHSSADRLGVGLGDGPRGAIA